MASHLSIVKFRRTGVGVELFFLPLPFLAPPTRKGLGTKLAISLILPTQSLGTRLIGCIHTGGRHIKCENDFEWHARTRCILMPCLCIFSYPSLCIAFWQLLGWETGNYYYFGLILMQVLYLVGILLVIFDLLTCTQSQGNCHQITLERRCLCSH